MNQFVFDEADTQVAKTVLLWGNRPCAAIGFVTESTGQLVVCEPVVFPEISAQIHRELSRELLAQVKRRAVSAGFQRLRLLRPACAGDLSFARLLTESGFVQATEIVQWDLSGVVSDGSSPQPQGTFQLYDFSANAAAAEIQWAIEAILTASEDLASQSLPTAKELLTQWQRLQANVFVYRLEQQIAGLICCGRNPTISAMAAAPKFAAESDVCIEYIGVVPAFRRRRIASCMIREIPALLDAFCNSHNQASASLETSDDPVTHQAITSERPDQSCHVERFSKILPQAFTVTAYADAANAPANSLYRRCGFLQSTRHQLWCCDLITTHNDACV